MAIRVNLPDIVNVHVSKYIRSYSSIFQRVKSEPKPFWPLLGLASYTLDFLTPSWHIRVPEWSEDSVFEADWCMCRTGGGWYRICSDSQSALSRLVGARHGVSGYLPCCRNLEFGGWGTFSGCVDNVVFLRMSRKNASQLYQALKGLNRQQSIVALRRCPHEAGAYMANSRLWKPEKNGSFNLSNSNPGSAWH